MKNLLLVREYLKKFYGQYEVFITPVLKFLLTLVTLTAINSKMHFMEKISSLPIVLVVSLMCSFLPGNIIVLVAAVFSLLHFYALGLECLLVALVVYLLLFLLYFRFSPKDMPVVLLTPMALSMGIPFAVPVAVGLTGTPAGAVSVACGAVVYYLISFITSSTVTLDSMETETLMVKLRFLTDGLLHNKLMMLTVAAFAFAVIVVYLIRRLSVDHAWTIAIVVGIISNALIMLTGALLLDVEVSVGMILLGAVLSFVIVVVLQFFVFNVDYTRTEHVQFEDDEYYYYVKAVPKITVAKPEKRVKKITPGRKK